MPKTPAFFQNKTILITGAASGIGLATAKVFAREGANVIVADINNDGATAVAKMLNDAHVDAKAITVDVTDRPAVQAMIAMGIKTFGRIDYLLNSAGSAGRRSSFIDIDTVASDIRIKCRQCVLHYAICITPYD